MNKLTIAAILILSFWCKPSLADDAAPAKPAQGNQGYIFGQAMAAQESAPSTNAGGIGDIWQGIKNVDAWIQKNLW